MRITPERYEAAKKRIAKVAKDQEVVSNYDQELKDNPVSKGRRVVAVDVNKKTGLRTLVTAKDEDSTVPLKKSG